MSLRTWKAEARHEKFKAASVTSWATWEHLLKWQKEGTKEQERKKERKKTEMWKARQKKEQKKRKWLPFVLTGNSRETGRCLHSCGLYTQPLLISSSHFAFPRLSELTSPATPVDSLPTQMVLNMSIFTPSFLFPKLCLLGKRLSQLWSKLELMSLYPNTETEARGKNNKTNKQTTKPKQSFYMHRWQFDFFPPSCLNLVNTFQVLNI